MEIAAEMATFSKLILKTSPLCAVLLDDMEAAAQAIECGRHSEALEMLSGWRSRALQLSIPSGCMPAEAPLVSEIIATAPSGVLEGVDIWAVQVAANALVAVMDKPIEQLLPGQIARAFTLIADMGLTLEVEEVEE